VFVRKTVSVILCVAISILGALIPSAAWAADPTVQSTTIPTGSGPLDVAITADGSKAYVVNFSSDNVSVVNLASGTTGTPIAAGNEPTSIAISPDGTFAYVTNYNNNASSTLTRINIAAGTSTNVSGAAGLVGPRSVVFSPDGSKAYVSNQASNPGKITVIDTTNNNKITDISVTSNPQNLAINSTGTKLYVSHTGAGIVSYIDLTTSPATVTTPITGLSGPQGLTLAGPNQGSLYVANQQGNTINVYDANSGTSTTTITGLNQPESVTVNPANTQIFVANQASNQVRIIDIATNTLIAPTLSVGTTPFYVAFAPNGLKAYVPNLGSNTLSVITYYQARTLSFATTSYTLDYGSTQTVVASPNIGVGTGTITYSSGSSTACTVGASTGLVTMTAGTGTCSISASITEGGTTVNNAYAAATTTTPVTITPQKVALTATASTQSIAVGSTVPTGYSLTSGNLVGTDAISGLTYTYSGTGSTSYSASTTPPTAAGTYSITPSNATFSPGNASNYAVTYSPGTLTISANAITITAGSQTINFGSTATSSFSITSGTLNGNDNISSVTYTYQGTGGTTYAASTTAPTAAGTYSVTPSAAVFSSGNASNYTITYSPGTLTINAATTTSVNLSLSALIGSPIAGSNANVSATGLELNSTYRVVVQSSPQTIATGNTANGSVNVSAPLPSNLSAGWHSLTFTGTAAGGASVTSVMYFKLSSTGILLQTSQSIPDELAQTGRNFSLLLFIATITLCAGLYLVRNNRKV
jgi:YVTN family beta-propeller protein